MASGESTPPMWPEKRYRSLSPASKAEAIARGQRELMEMVRSMPEGCFELSLRDMVEKPDLNLGPKRSSTSGSKIREAERGGGFLLKMVLPVPVGMGMGSYKRKNKDKEWWKRKIPILEGTTTTTTTNRRGRSILPSCCSFFRPKKTEHQQPKNGLQEL